MKDLDREVLPDLAEDLLLLLLDDLSGPVVGIDDVVTDLEVDALSLAGDLDVFDVLVLSRCLGGDGVLLNQVRPVAGRDVMSADSGPRG
jgi:hypothetical protein